ncbi:hypothetical protein D9M72_371100 [compost metagenome]
MPKTRKPKMAQAMKPLSREMAYPARLARNRVSGTEIAVTITLFVKDEPRSWPPITSA